ncbi:MAG: serine/threonine-protein kinase [Kofleriaceae bacterium]
MRAEGHIVGNYLLRSVIGRGGMSEVYAAEHRFLGEPVAVKLLRWELARDDAAIESFVSEAAKTRAVDHPNVVRLIDFGRDDATACCYLVMERVDGENLAARLRRVGRLAEPDVRRLGAAIADGMHAAHERGIVHRDLKPANVMLRGDQPKIVDFGIAKSLGNQSAVTTSRRIGTPAYMAPEQLTGGLIAPCVDIWALGAILFESATGRLPFESFADGRCPQLFETPPRASSLAPLSSALDDLIARCLARDPGLRPASMSHVARALREAWDVEVERITQDIGAPASPAWSAQPPTGSPSWISQPPAGAPQWSPQLPAEVPPWASMNSPISGGAASGMNSPISGGAASGMNSTISRASASGRT